jgi:hypothetical protein
MFIPDPDFLPYRIPDPRSQIPDNESWISDPGSNKNKKEEVEFLSQKQR